MQPAERAALVEAHAWIVAQFVARYEQRGNGADLAEAGLLGLCEAARRFTPGRGVQFGTYAWNWVKGAVLEELRTAHLIPLSKRAALGKTQSPAAPALVFNSARTRVYDPDDGAFREFDNPDYFDAAVRSNADYFPDAETAVDVPRRRAIARDVVLEGLEGEARAVALCALEGRSVEQIAQALELPAGRVLYLLCLAEQHFTKEAA